MTKLEIYGIALVGLLLVFFGAYLKGRHDEATEIHQRQLAADATELQKQLKIGQDRADEDAKARDMMSAFINVLNGKIQNVQKQFASIPQVVIDASGCPAISDAARLRWNAVTGMPTGSADDGAAGQPERTAEPTVVPHPF